MNIPLDVVADIIRADRAVVSDIEIQAVKIASIVTRLSTTVKQVVAQRADPRETIWLGPDAIDFGQKFEPRLDELAGTCAKLRACAADLFQETVALERELNERMSRPVASPWDSRPA
jgi:hypothetical protein